MRRVLPQRPVAILLLALLVLAACGRPGPIRPPGPPDQVTSGRMYPSK